MKKEKRPFRIISVYVDPALYSLIQEYAKRERRSLSEAVSFLASKALEEHKR